MREWMIDSATTPEIVVDATHESVDLPRHLAGNDAVVLIISDQATAGLEIGNEWISTRTRSNGAAHMVRIPIAAVRAVRARETGHMVPLATAGAATTPQEPDENKARPKRPALRVIK